MHFFLTNRRFIYEPEALLFSDSSLTKDILKPDSELLDEIGQKLNKEIRALKGWRNLAYRLGIPTDVYAEFDLAKKKAKSATRMLFEWLMRRRSDLSIDDLLKALKEIDRNDVIELVKEETALGTVLHTCTVATLKIYVNVELVSDSNVNSPSHKTLLREILVRFNCKTWQSQ